MVVVVIVASGAGLALYAYNSTKRSDPQRLDRALNSIKQAAGVMGAICTAIFGIITALQTARMPGSSWADRETGGIVFGKRAHER